MKKQERNNSKGNIIPFPDLEKRLLTRGLDYLQNKKYQQAIRLLEEAKSIDERNDEVYIGLVLAYYEIGSLQKAKDLALEMLKRDMGDYFQTVDLYLMILVQMKSYEEIITTIEILLEEREIPADKLEHFSKLLAFSRKMVDENPSWDSAEMEEILDYDQNPSLQLNEIIDPNKQVLVIAELSKKNVRPYIEEINLFLQDDKSHPFLKTMLLNILQEQEYESGVLVEKFGRKKTVTPSKLFTLHEYPMKDDIQKVLQEHLENEDPVLYQQTISLFERHLFLLYPFELGNTPAACWAGAYHYTGMEYSGVEVRTMEDIAEEYAVNRSEMEESCHLIKKLEKISYPII
ncbi:tetratricopeptide repeat protein [Bacillus dakarensis]|uniref:tetratricopeptide repeat protein n=1 Tax=Robertmurraya dakarensis TaxID=1926278 RepID=UPI000981A005|nr:tetratricopeptide repeat protein [Bacillus dakarensis]